jgi:hypothetical protein
LASEYGAQGPVLRPRCIGTERAQTQLLLYSTQNLVSIDERSIIAISMEIRIKLGRVQIYAILALFFVTQKFTKIMLLKSMKSGSLNMNKHKFNTMSSFKKYNSSLVFQICAQSRCAIHIFWFPVRVSVFAL